MATRKQRQIRPAATPKSSDAASAQPPSRSIYSELRIPEGSLPVVNDPDFVDLLHELCDKRRPDTERAQRIAIWWALSRWQELRALQGDTEAWQRLEDSKACPDPAGRDALEDAAWKDIRAWNRVEEYAQKGEFQALDAWMEWTAAMPPKRKTKRQREFDALQQRKRARLGPRYREPTFPPVRTRLDGWRETFIRQALILHFRTGVERLAAFGIHVPVFN